jgi:hypothetical protein
MGDNLDLYRTFVLSDRFSRPRPSRLVRLVGSRPVDQSRDHMVPLVGHLAHRVTSLDT